MFAKRITIFRLLGFPIQVDLSWVFLVFLLGWSLSRGLFPNWYEQLAADTYTWMGILGTLGFVSSILLHELAHAVVARSYGLSIRSITLFIFGGVAELEDEPPHARAELWVTAAGPFASLLLAGTFYGLYLLSVQQLWPESAEGLFRYLAWLNGLLVVFNLIPAFPLDGGRILRAILWAWRKDLTWATRIAASIGSAFGSLMIGLAIVQLIFYKQMVQAFWWFLIGVFMRNASQSAFHRMRLREILRGEPIRPFVSLEDDALPSYLSIQQFVEEHLEKEPHSLYPVLDVNSNQLVGCVRVNDLYEMPPHEWPHNTLRAIAKPCAPELTIDIESDALQAVTQMNQQQSSRLMVLDQQSHYIGMITMQDLIRFLTKKMGFDEQEEPPMF
ncbi:MAG: site-2 protease family protein [Myxococcales bacterium]|nr:site-2 protease family protein [Myxococcales bacterium]MCB9642986.1 site-2 protease family protein [Myxococcales bacterium]